MKIFNSLGHFFAWVVGRALPAASRGVEAVAAAAVSPLGNAIAGLAGLPGATVQAGIEAIAGDVLNAFGAAGEAIGAEGLNVNFDRATVAAIQAIYNELKALFGRTGTSAAAVSAPTPASPQVGQ